MGGAIGFESTEGQGATFWVDLPLRRDDAAGAELLIIVVSASVEEGRLAIDGDFSAIDWLPKPLVEDRLLLALEQALPRERPAHPRVLHVEDDADLHQVTRGMVGSGFEFAHAASLSDARTLLGQAHYDLVLLDLSLPDGSGWELLPLIREQTPTPRVIILSGIELSREEAGKFEATLLKSHVSPHQLLEALNARIKKHKEMTP